MDASIGRVYDSALARRALGWRPNWDFEATVARLRETSAGQWRA
jgi:nucleoside-diphosphate-sugar epimerase